MNPFSFVAAFFWHFGDVILEAAYEALQWLKIHDFPGRRARKAMLTKAPASFARDKLPVVPGADDHSTLRYDEQGFSLMNRQSRQTIPASAKMLRCFARKGMKGLRKESRRLRAPAARDCSRH